MLGVPSWASELTGIPSQLPEPERADVAPWRRWCDLTDFSLGRRLSGLLIDGRGAGVFLGVPGISRGKEGIYQIEPPFSRDTAWCLLLQRQGQQAGRVYNGGFDVPAALLLKETERASALLSCCRLVDDNAETTA